MPVTGLYTYAADAPVDATDPNGLQPKFEGDECAGTDCDEKEGIKTWENPNADRSCKHQCKQFIWESHEAIHRKNMEPCCKLRNKCLSLAAKQPPSDAAKYRKHCLNAWVLWRAASRNSLERLAAVKSCYIATWLGDNATDDGTGGYPLYCCSIAKAEAKHLCANKDPNATLACCPFQADGQLDVDCYIKLSEDYKSKHPEYKKNPQ